MIKRVISVVVCIIVMAVPFHVGNTDVTYAYARSENVNIRSNEDRYTPQSDIIVWIYKKVGGRLYRRQYNETKQKWIGEWKPA